MNTAVALALLLLALLLGLSAILVLRSTLPGARGRRLTARLAAAAHAGPPAGPDAGGGGRAVTRSRLQSGRGGAAGPAGLGLAAAMFGYAPERLHQYPAPPPVLIAMAALAALPVGYYAVSAFGGWGWGFAPAAWVLGARGLFRIVHGRRAEAMYRQLPDALAMVVRSVRAGIPVSEALRTVAREMPEPTGVEFRRLSDELGIGIPLDQALLDLARRSGLPEYGFFKVALTLQGTAGGNLTETLENLADVVRKRVATRARGMALASQARASAYILAALPVVTGGALLAINPGYLRLLFEDPRGRTILAAAVLSLLTGLGTMKLIIKRSLA